MITLAAVSLILLGALPGFFLIREAVRDPVFRALDDLSLPAWAAGSQADDAQGSRWCVGVCRIRQRAWHSTKPVSATATAFEDGLAASGWERWLVKGCPPHPVDGPYSCWRRDEYVLDLAVHPTDCGETGGDCKGALVTVVVRNRVADPRGR